MAECVLPARKFERSRGQDTEPIMLSRGLARAWAIGTGRVEETGGELPLPEDTDSIGLSIIAVANSERPEEDFGAVCDQMAGMTKGVATCSRQVLARMVKAAEATFGPSTEPLPPSS